MPKLDRIVTVRIAIEARNDFGEVAELVLQAVGHGVRLLSWCCVSGG